MSEHIPLELFDKLADFHRSSKEVLQIWKELHNFLVEREKEVVGIEEFEFRQQFGIYLDEFLGAFEDAVVALSLEFKKPIKIEQ